MRKLSLLIFIVAFPVGMVCCTVAPNLYILLLLLLFLLWVFTGMRTQNGGENQYSLPFSRKVFNAANMLANGYPKDALRQLEGVPDGVSVDGVTAAKLRKRIREKLATEG